MRQGFAKGGPKTAETAKRRLGYAQRVAGKKADAAKTFASVRGTDGSVRLAKLWVIEMRSATK